jgi:peroxin-4
LPPLRHFSRNKRPSAHTNSLILIYHYIPYSLLSFIQIFHPNVHFRTGDICLDILKQEWSPAWGLQAACRAVLALLSDYDADSPLNCDAGNMVRGGDLAAYNDTAAMYTMENAQFISWPPMEGVMTSTSTTTAASTSR